MVLQPSPDKDFDLNFRIISCRKLLKGDRNSSDPYVKIMLGKRELHRTKYMLKTLSPVFAPKHDNSFSTKINYGVLKAVGGIGIEVKDWDRIGNNDLIGIGKIDPARVLDLAKIGKPVTIPLDVPKGRKEEEAGFITLCIQDTGDDSDDEWSNDGSATALDDDVVAPLPKSALRPSVTNQVNKGPPPGTYDKELLVYIMSCQGLIAADMNGLSDPYVEINMGGNKLHKTGWVENSLNPAFSVDHRNNYILKCSAETLWANGGIEFHVRDHDVLGKDDHLGYVKIPPGKLYESNGEYTEYKLAPPPNTKGNVKKDAGSIFLVIREAKLADKDKKAAAELEAISGVGRSSIMVDDRAEWDAEAAHTTVKPKREKVYMEDSDSSSDSSDMYMDSSGDEGPTAKPTSSGAAKNYFDSSDDEMPEQTELAEQNTSKWGNQKSVKAGGRGAGRGGRGGRGGTVTEDRGGRGALYVPSIQPGDLFDREVQALEDQQAAASDDETDHTNMDLEKDQEGNDMWEQLIEKDAKINELEQQVETLKEQNSELRSELNKMRYKLKANLPPKKKANPNKVPLARKRSAEEEEAALEDSDAEEKTKTEETSMPPSVLKKGKFSALDFDGPSDDDTVEKAQEDEKVQEATQARLGASLDFGLDAPTFSSDESEDDGDEDKPPTRGVTPLSSVVSDDSAASPKGPTRGNVLPPSRGIPGVHLSELGMASPAQVSSRVLAPTKGIPGVRLSEIETSTRTSASEETPTSVKRGVRWHGSKSIERGPSLAPGAYGSGDESLDSDDESRPNRDLLGKLGLTESMIGRQSMYSFIQDRPAVEDKNTEDTNEAPDFDRKHKDMQFAKMDFVGIASKKDRETLEKKSGSVKALPSLAFNPSVILSADEDSDDERKRGMVGISVDKDYDKTSRGSSGSFLEETTTTVVSQTAIQQTTISNRRVFELEQQVQELKEELELAMANPGGYEKVSLEVQLKVAQDSSKKLQVENERLQKMNKIQKEAMFELTSKQKGSFW